MSGQIESSVYLDIILIKIHFELTSQKKGCSQNIESAPELFSNGERGIRTLGRALHPTLA